MSIVSQYICNMELVKFEENSKYGYRDENETMMM